MGTLKEFLEKLKADEEFRAKVNAAVAAKQEAGITDGNKILIAAAEECGYSVTEEELEAYAEEHKNQITELSEEDMGKVSGGELIACLVTMIGVGVFITYATKSGWDDYYEEQSKL